MSIRVEGLSKMYGTQRAVDAISFSAEKGEILGFLGPNGAGKSTTMKMLTCFISADEGRAEVAGLDVSEKPEEVRRKIGYLPEHNPLYPDMYVWEYLHFMGELCGLKGKSLDERIAEIIRMCGLQREQHKKIGMLSKGYRQRVGLGQALIHDPEVLILDEPTTGLDPNQIIEIRELIRAIGKEKTIIFSTHILSEVEAIAGRVVIINRGKIVADESMQNLKAGAEGENLFRIEFEKSGFDFSRIQKLEGFIALNAESPERFSLRFEKNADVRPLLFDESLKQGIPLSAFSKSRQSLEEIFRNLTKS